MLKLPHVHAVLEKHEADSKDLAHHRIKNNQKIMKHFGIVLLSCIVLSGCCSCNDRFFTNAEVLGETLDIVVRDGVIMQCYTSGSKENSACKNVEVTDCAGNLLVPTSNVKTLLESFTLEGKERFALSDIQGSMEKGV